MTVEEVLVTILYAHSGLTALIGTRLYANGEVPANERRDYVVYQEISSPRDHTHSGPSGYSKPRIQFYGYSETHAGAKAIQTQLRLALDGYSGEVGGEKVWGTFVVNANEIPDPTTDLFRAGIDAIVHFREATA